MPRYQSEAFNAVRDEEGKLQSVIALGVSQWWGIPASFNWWEY